MANVQHSSLTGAELHEPKGVAAASSNQTYVANGSGSGAWSFDETNGYTDVTAHLTDIASASSTWVVSPIAGSVTKVYSVIHGAIDADTVLTVKIGGSAMTNGTTTVTASGSAAGDVDTISPTGSNTVTAGQAIEIASDGAATSSSAVTLTVRIQES